MFWTIHPVVIGNVEEGKKIKLKTDGVDMCPRLRSQYCLNLTSYLSQASETIHCRFTLRLSTYLYAA
jgi:hypothetical protein